MTVFNKPTNSLNHLAMVDKTSYKLNPARFKILSSTLSGLNDSIGALLYITKFFEINSLDFSNVHFAHFVYKDLDTYFDFNQIQYVKDPVLEEYDFVARIHNGGLTQAFSTEYINKFISFKKKFITEGEIFKDYIGIHFRHYKSEVVSPDRDKTFSEEVQEYSQRFLARYSPNEKYLIVADNPVWKDFFEDKKNISYLVVPEAMVAPFAESRERYLGFSVSHLCGLAACKKIYTTYGSFHRLTRLINDKIPKEKL
jgi:hypothetical protein